MMVVITVCSAEGFPQSSEPFVREPRFFGSSSLDSRASIRGHEFLLDHVKAVNERHLKCLLSEYVRYCHEVRTQLGLGKGTPGGWIRAEALGRIISHERLGRMDHRYDRAALWVGLFVHLIYSHTMRAQNPA
jgi:hypothetical protein